jgi:hypothetical protein
MLDDDLVSFLISQGHSDERAQQIAGNHPDAVRADMEKQKGANDGEKEKDAPAQQEGAVPQT